MAEEREAFSNFYQTLDEKESTPDGLYFRLFNNGDYYSVYGENAETLADTFFLTRSVLKTIKLSTDTLSYTTISSTKYPAALTHIISHLNRPVLIYTRPSGSSKKSKDSWSRTERISPGDLSAANDVVEPRSPPILLGFYIEEFDVESPEFQSLSRQFPSVKPRPADADQTNASRAIICTVVRVDTHNSTLSYTILSDTPGLPLLRALILQQQPTECILFTSHHNTPSAATEYKSTSPASEVILESIEDELTSARALTFRSPLYMDRTQSSVMNLLMDKHLYPSSLDKSRELFTNSPIALGIVASMLQHVGAVDDDGLTPTYCRSVVLSETPFSLTDLVVKSTMRIDHNTLVSLGVLPNPGDTHRTMSLLGLLQQTITPGGHRLLQSWVRGPILDIHLLNSRHHTVEAFLATPDYLGSFRAHLKGIADIEKVIAKLQKVYTLQSVTAANSADVIKDLLQLFFFTVRLPEIASTLTSISTSGTAGEAPPLDMSIFPKDVTSDPTTLTKTEMNDQAAGADSSSTPSAPETSKNKIDPDHLITASIKMSPQTFLHHYYSSRLTQMATTVTKYAQLMQATIDFNAITKHEYMVKSQFNSELAKIEEEKEKLQHSMDRIHKRVAQDLNLDTNRVKLNHTKSNNHGYHLRVTRRDERSIRNSKEYITLETRKDGVRFTTTELRGLSRAHEELMTEYNAIQAESVTKILDAAATYFTLFTTIQTTITELDVLSTFAYLCATSHPQYVRPRILFGGISIGPDLPELDRLMLSQESLSSSSSSSTTASPADTSSRTLPDHVIFKDARHPCLEIQPTVSFIANDIELVHGKSHLQIITGPNMGGKSTYIRSAALLTILAQIGCFVPCSSASLTLVDCILARVGAGDSQLKRMSTFMKEMVETSEILKHATNHSLIIIDELGRGTSTYDGFGLAYGIAEHLATKIQSYTLFATHFHELTAMSQQVPGVINKHVSAVTGDGTITMVYQVKDGHCDRSFGIHVSELANFPPQVVATARQKANELEQFGDDSALDLKLPKQLTIDSERKVEQPSVDMVSLRNINVDDPTASSLLERLFAQNGSNDPLNLHDLVHDDDVSTNPSSLPPAKRQRLVDAYNTILDTVSLN